MLALFIYSFSSFPTRIEALVIGLRVSLTALGLCIWANAITILPAYPEDRRASREGKAVTIGCLPPVVSEATVGTTADVASLYDSTEGKWKKWFVAQLSAGGVTRAVIMMSESEDGQTWSTSPEPALSGGDDSDAFDYSGVAAPSIVFFAGGPVERRYALWYCGFNSRRQPGAGLSEGAIGLAFSSDGRHFTRLPSQESPFKRQGLVLGGRQSFPDAPLVWEGGLGEPRVVVSQGTFHMWFSKIGRSRSGEIVCAGIAHAVSADGIKWSTETVNPLTFHFDAKRVSPQYLLSKLHNLTQAFSQSVATQ